MAEPGSTRSKAEACLLADEALAALMKPVNDCPMRRIGEGRDHNRRLDQALVAVILGSTVLEIMELETFKAGHARASGMTTSAATKKDSHLKESHGVNVKRKKKERKEHETTGERARREEKREKETRTTLDTSAQVEALEKRVT
jgi:hypothetical protein